MAHSTGMIATRTRSATPRHDFDRVALLLDGRIAHQWTQNELGHARTQGESLEDLVADRMEASTAPSVIDRHAGPQALP
ncbi:MAG: hypothetical protein R3F04_11205 [Lysobacteraceae bacterium]